MNHRPDPLLPSRPWHLCVAPMMDWTDRHCRHFHRLLSRGARLYTEMITTGALLHGDVPRHLDFDPLEHPLALQLGGSEPADLAQSARLAQRWGYDEVNLNCGCPSERVQRGAFGACLMKEPALVADAVAAMRDAVDIPVTVKHRIGVDEVEHYGFVRDFVGTVADAGCELFIVHARSAWLKGLSPKENRERPPLRYETVRRLKADFPALRFVLNGGITTHDEIAQHLQDLDGVMLGRAAYRHPWMMSVWDSRFFGAREHAAPERQAVESAMVRYMEGVVERGEPWSRVARHMMGLWDGMPGARRWRQVWSDHRLNGRSPREVQRLAAAARTEVAAATIAEEATDRLERLPEPL